MLQSSIILFDGVCNLCNRSVKFIIKRDKKNRFRFASLQSPQGQKILKNSQLPANNFNSFVLIANGKVYTKSTAALQVARSLGNLWPLLYVFIMVPEFIRDAVYNLVAKNRFKWFGKKEECLVPDVSLKARFLI